jgi:predicted HAD superfamily Cof-like phosphohydrolase
MTELADVRKFRVQFEEPVSDAPVHLTQVLLAKRVTFLFEELRELIEAGATHDLAKQADALADIVYVALGTVLLMGLPWEKIWAEIQAVNMRKEKQPNGDIKRPKGCPPPDIEKILKKAGYDPEHPVYIDDHGSPR